MGATARIDGGVLADLVDGMKVEAEGHTTTGGVLNAEKITIKDNIRIEANATTAGSANVLGKTVTITSGTRLDNLASSASITAGDGLRVRGFVNRDGSTITATRVTKQQPGRSQEVHRPGSGDLEGRRNPYAGHPGDHDRRYRSVRSR